jgi:hypothetical protein
MRILHLSDDGLPDWRVEKSALTARKNGHQVFFAGRLNAITDSAVFSKVHSIKWSAGAMIGIPYYYHRVKKQIERLVGLVKPDIVHAHNIGSAKISHELKLPVVFDDHEYFKMLSLVNAENMKFRDNKGSKSGFSRAIYDMKLSFISRKSITNWTKWETELVSSVPTITVSEQIANDLRKMRDGSLDIFVVPNFPLEVEATEFTEPREHENLTCVYAGGDSKHKQVTNRDISGLTELFMNQEIGNLTIIGWEVESSEKFRATGLLPRKKMFHEMFQNSIGLIPWKKHWSHPFLNPNKAYEYAHAGLFVMLTSDLTSVVHTLGDNCLTFEDYDDMALKLKYFKANMNELNDKRLRIFNYAKNNLIWEKYEKNIIDAYNAV